MKWRPVRPGWMQLGEVVPEGLPLGLVPSGRGAGRRHDVLVGRVDDGPEGQVARSRAGLAVCVSSRGIPNNGRPVLSRATRRPGRTAAPRRSGSTCPSPAKRANWAFHNLSELLPDWLCGNLTVGVLHALEKCILGVSKNEELDVWEICAGYEDGRATRSND